MLLVLLCSCNTKKKKIHLDTLCEMIRKSFQYFKYPLGGTARRFLQNMYFSSKNNLKVRSKMFRMFTQMFTLYSAGNFEGRYHQNWHRLANLIAY